MERPSSSRRPRRLALACLVTLAVAVTQAQSNAPQPPAPKLAEEAFKNIQVLKGTPADQVIPAMQLISASLGQGCDFCHVQGAFEKDDKEPKKVARYMMQMMFGINKEHFYGHREVTCYSCHHGASKPLSIPILSAQQTPPLTETPGANLPTAEHILDRYLEALGGSATLQKVSSRVAKGKAIAFGGRHFPVEVFAEAPDKLATIVHLPTGDTTTAFDGRTGWMNVPGKPARDLEGAELDALRLDADFLFPLKIKERFTELRVESPDKLDTHDTLVVVGQRKDTTPIRFYFDSHSNLLIRELRYTETPLGRLPTQIDYSDYRESGGIKIPFRRAVIRAVGNFTTEIEQVQQNVPIDDSKFSKPAQAAEVGKPARP